MASLNDIQFRGKNDTLLWRATRQICAGGVNPIIVPRYDSVFAPFPGIKTYGSIPHSDGSVFSDGAGYYQSVIDVTCAGGADLRASRMTVNLNYCGALVGGESFSILHETFDWRLYEIGAVEMLDDTTAEITFNPPLREAIADLTALEFDRPRCLMRLADPKAMDLNVTTYPFSRPSVKFVEAKYR